MGRFSGKGVRRARDDCRDMQLVWLCKKRCVKPFGLTRLFLKQVSTGKAYGLYPGKNLDDGYKTVSILKHGDADTVKIFGKDVSAVA